MLFDEPITVGNLFGRFARYDDTLSVVANDSLIRGVAPASEAAANEMTWVRDASVAVGEPGVLVAPHSFRGNPNHLTAIIRVTHPRLAFAKVVAELFSKVLGERAQLYSTDAAGAVVVNGIEVQGVGDFYAFPSVQFADGCRVGAGSVLGSPGFSFIKDDGDWLRFPHLGGVTIGANVEIGAGVTIDSGGLAPTTIGDGTKISNSVQISHNVKIGRRCLIAGNVSIGGGTQIGDDVWIGPNSVISNKLSIGSSAKVEIGSVVVEDIKRGERVSGNFARAHTRRMREYVLLKED